MLRGFRCKTLDDNCDKRGTLVQGFGAAKFRCKKSTPEVELSLICETNYIRLHLLYVELLYILIRYIFCILFVFSFAQVTKLLIVCLLEHLGSVAFDTHYMWIQFDCLLLCEQILFAFGIQFKVGF